MIWKPYVLGRRLAACSGVGQEMGEEGTRRDDFDAKGLSQVEQVRVSRDDEPGVGGQRGGQIRVV